MEFTAQQIADLVGGEIVGNANASVSTLSKIEEGKPGSISFLANPTYTPHLYTSEASIVIINKSFEVTKAVNSTLIKVENADAAFAKLLEMYNQVKLNKSGISKMTSIDESSKLGENIYAGEFVVIGKNVTIGNNVKLYPHVFIGDNSVIGDDSILFSGVKVYSESMIGKRCIFHSGTVIGSDGFRFNPTDNHKKVPQIGNVIIEDDVELGANCAIDRATLGSTILRKGVKFDNMVHIAHNVEVGQHTYIAAQSVVGGSTIIGKNCMFSGQVGMVGHIKIADGTKLGAQTGVSKSIKTPNTIHIGTPSQEARDFKINTIHARNLGKLVERVKTIEKQLKA